MPEILSVRNRARFVPPTSRGPMVSRDRLDHLYAGGVGRIVRVMAPPGYGKSTQVARWVAEDDRAVGWIDVEPIDNDPFVLASAVLRALPCVASAATDLHSGVVGDLAPHLRSAIDDLRDPFVLVLDDVHHLDAPGALAVVDALATRLPAGSTLVMCGRSQPDDAALARRRLTPGIVDVTTTDLALNATETDELLTSMGIRLELDALTHLCERFEGWTAGVRLAGLVLQGEGERAWLSPESAGDATFVVDYLRSEWTGQLKPDDRQLLREAACLDRFTGDMCDKILGRRGSLAQLRRMHREELLVLPLDQRDEWFRMHPLVARWLSTELREEDSDRYRAIHTAASEWWRRNGDIDLAFDHAHRGGDLATAEALVCDHGGSFVSRNLQVTVRRWLESFPQDHLHRSAGLCSVQVVEALHLGDSARALHWYDHVERLLGRDPSPHNPLRERADALRITLAWEPSTDLLPVAEAVARTHQGDTWGALALWALGGVRFLAGDPRAAEAVANAAFLAELNDVFLMRANCVAVCGILAELAGDREAAEHHGRTARELLVGYPSTLPATTAPVDAILAVIEARQGRRDLAGEHLESGRLKLATFQTVAPWFNVLGRLALARAALLVDDRTASRILLQELEHDLRDEPGDNGARPHLDALRESVEAARDLPAGQAWALTEAELRVLQHLPTNLTLGDIATRLFVSRNTVKSHVAAIYRKLGARSRSDAVDLARRTGMLEATSD